MISTDMSLLAGILGQSQRLDHSVGLLLLHYRLLGPANQGEAGFSVSGSLVNSKWSQQKAVAGYSKIMCKNKILLGKMFT